MMIIMRTDASKKEIEAVIERVESNGLHAHVSVGAERTVIGAVGESRQIYRDQFLLLSGVDRVVPISRPFKLASREFRPENSLFPLDGVEIGSSGVVIIAGPCSVESRSQLLETAQAVAQRFQVPIYLYGGSPEVVRTLRANLLAYCRRDTEALLELFRALR